MVRSITNAFAAFRRNCVDLDKSEVDTARKSRDYLQQQIISVAGEGKALPRLEPKYSSFVSSGSFARSTKIRPLDDIDFFLVLASLGVTMRQSLWDEYVYYLKPTRDISLLGRLTNAKGNVSSTRVLNILKTALATVPNYTSAHIHRNGEVVSLKLSSYPWVFDIVPAVAHVSFWTGEVDWYLMPNGKGDWMRSNPRKDTLMTTQANQRHNGLLLPVIRLIKYWSSQRLRQRLSSYYVETLCLKVFETQRPIMTLQAGVETFFRKAPYWVRSRCSDPKGYGPRLDQHYGRETKERVVEALRRAARTTRSALNYERAGDVQRAFEAWNTIFGREFPRFGS